MRIKLKTFLASDEGAVTTDWVVLAAAVVGLGVTSVTVVRNGAGNLSGEIRTALENASVAAICQGGTYEMRHYVDDQAEKASIRAEELSQIGDEDLLNGQAEIARKVQSLRENGADEREINVNLDEFALVSAEIERRRLESPPDVPTLASLAGLTEGGGCGGDGGSGAPGLSHDLVYYNDPRFAEDYAAYQDEFSRLDPREISRVIEELDANFHEALSAGKRDDAAKLLDLEAMLYQEALERGDPETVTNARNRYERALAAWQEARL